MASEWIPDVRIEVGLTGPITGANYFTVGDPTRGQVGINEIGPDDVWSDISPWVRNWSFRRGATRADGPVLRYEAGTFIAQLNNGGREFDPTHLTGPYAVAGVSLLTPMVRVRVTAYWAGIAYRLWYGYADAWTPDYDSTTWSTVTLTATDGFKVFAANDRTASTSQGGGELSGPRVNRILTDAGWSAVDRVIASGNSTLQATTLADNALAELQAVAESEIGEFWMDKLGRAVFRGRHSLFEDERSTTPQATFGDLPAENVSYSYDFEAGIAGWAATGGTATSSAVQAHDGTSSMLTTVTGSPTLVYTRRAAVPVVAGHRYRLTFWVYAPTGGNLSAAVDWADPVDYLSTSYTNSDIDAATWTQLNAFVTAPGGATEATFGPTMYSDVPFTAGYEFYVDGVEFADLDTEIPYASAPVMNDDTTMANRVIASRVGGTDQVANDTASQDRYLVKTYPKSGLLLENDSDALQYAEFVLYQSKDPELRFAEVTFNVPTPNLSAVAWPTLLARELGDRVAVIRRPPGGGDPNFRDVFIRGIEMNSDGEDFKIRFPLQSATKYQFFTIADPSLGRIGYNAIAW